MGVSVGVGGTSVSVGVGGTSVSVGDGGTAVLVGVGGTGVSVGDGESVAVGVGGSSVSVAVGGGVGVWLGKGVCVLVGKTGPPPVCPPAPAGEAGRNGIMNEDRKTAKAGRPVEVWYRIRVKDTLVGSRLPMQYRCLEPGRTAWQGRSYSPQPVTRAL
jgi:hypothetical protein